MDERIKIFFMSVLLNNIKNKFANNIFINEKLSKYSWFNLGGPAEIFFKPKDTEQLSAFLKSIKGNFNEINILGAGSNTLIRDGGIKGVTIKLSSKFSYTNSLENNLIEVGAATLDRQVANFAMQNSLTNFEFLSCIPGSLGGAIVMNSGCYGKDISKILSSIRVIDLNGNISVIKRNDINFSYRGSNLPKNLIILSAKLQGKLSDSSIINQKQSELIKRKKESQPSQIKTCGSTFKNPDDKKAWQLIKESNSDKLSVGFAKISEKHCNFFVNEGGASSNEVEELINKVKKNVLDTTGIKLELEIKVIGNN
jgi:UDP-N-acetylmuramate dehydrogenase